MKKLFLFLCGSALALNVNSQLKKAQIENATSTPSGATTQYGRFWLRTDSSPNTFNYQDSSATREVATTNTTQTLTGKTLSGASIASSTLSSSTVLSTSPSHVVINNGSGQLSSEAQLAITRGGTGQATASAALSALSPMFQKGDLIAHSGTSIVRVGVGSDGDVLTADSTKLSGFTYSTPATAPDQSYEIRNLTLTASSGSSALTVALKTKAGSDPSAGDPVKIGFRSSTSTAGTYNQRTSSAATSIVISAGSTLGQASGVAGYVYVYALDNSGTIELAVSSSIFDEGTIKSTTSEGGAGAADSNATVYSTTARSNVPIRLIGRIAATQTSGNWASAPTEISLIPFQEPVVMASYNTTQNTSFAVDETVINFSTKIFDTHNAFTTGGSSKFTAPIAGRYAVIASLAANGTASAAVQWCRVGLYVNNSVYQYGPKAIFWTTNATAVPVVYNSVVNLAAGDYIDLRTINTVNTACALTGTASENFINIYRIGN